VAADLDQELRNLQDIAFMLAAAHYFLVDDPVALDRHVSSLLMEGALGLAVRDLSGELLVNTCTAARRAFPAINVLDRVAYSAKHDRSHISGLIVEPISGDPLLTIDLPIRREENSELTLSLCVLPRILQILLEQHLPNGWTAVIVDDNHGAIASVRESVGGTFAAAGGDAVAMPAVDSDSLTAESGNSSQGYTASSAVDLAGWTVTVNVPDEIFFGPVRRALFILFAGCGATAAVVLILAVNIGRRIAGPFGELTAIARAIGKGRQVSPLMTGIDEADLVAQVLCSTSKDLSRRATELTQTVEALRHREKQLQNLSDELQRILDERTELLNRMVSAQENERQRIARELHDHLGQYFAAMLLGLNAADRASSWHDEGHQRIADLKAVTSAMSSDVHRLSWELRPTALDDLGLEAAIANYLETWRARFKLNVDFVGNLRGRRLPAPVEITLYRVLQEAMTNIAKHAQAEKISVVLEAETDEVHLIVEDDGIGFTTTKTAAPVTPTSGFGLLGIRERLALVGGSLIIEPVYGHGTAIFCRVPA
jgi:signal transduction histidine kinase